MNLIYFKCSYIICKYYFAYCTNAAFDISSAFVPYKYQTPTAIALQTEAFNVAAAETYYKIFEQAVGGDSVNRLYRITASSMYAGSRPYQLKVTVQPNTSGSAESTVAEVTADSIDKIYLEANYVMRTYGATVRLYASYRATTNKGAAYLIIDQYKI